MHTKSTFIVGIDPSSNHSGVAVIEDGRYTQLLKLNFFDLQDHVANTWPASAQYYVEDPKYMRAIHRSRVDEDVKMQAMQQHKAAAIARCRQAGLLIIEMLERNGRAVHLVKPQKGESKKTKNDATYFNRLTGWTGRSNKDNRDAAMLIFGFCTQRGER